MAPIRARPSALINQADLLVAADPADAGAAVRVNVEEGVPGVAAGECNDI